MIFIFFFLFSPTPDVHWERSNGQPLPDNHKTLSFGQELVFEKLEFDNAGSYECWATNDISSNREIRTFMIRVVCKWLDSLQTVLTDLPFIHFFLKHSDFFP